jgi:hypothetical protein
MDRATFSFKNPTKRVKDGKILDVDGVITVDVNKTDFAYPELQKIHNEVIKHVRDPYTKDGINGFTRSRQGRSANQGIGRYTKEVDQDELKEFKNMIYSKLASASFVDTGDKDVIKDYVNSLVNEMDRMTIERTTITNMDMSAGKRRTKRRNKRSAKKSKRKSRRYSKKH